MRNLGLGALLAFATLACDLHEGKVAHGQLYLSGEARFDTYFRDVHAIQVWAAQWPEDKKATRRPLVGILDLTPDAADVTIAQATHEKMESLSKEDGGTRLDTFVDEARVVATGSTRAEAGLFRAIEETATGELQRAKKLNSMLPKLDDLATLGHSLEPHVQETFQKQTPGRMAEVKSELGASFTILSALSGKARRTMRECDDFVSDLQRAVATGTEMRGKHHERPKTSEKPEQSDKPESKPPPVAKPTRRVDPAPPQPSPPTAKPVPVAKRDDPAKSARPVAPPPKPAAKSSEGEVFNP